MKQALGTGQISVNREERACETGEGREKVVHTKMKMQGKPDGGCRGMLEDAGGCRWMPEDAGRYWRMLEDAGRMLEDAGGFPCRTGPTETSESRASKQITGGFREKRGEEKSGSSPAGFENHRSEWCSSFADGRQLANAVEEGPRRNQSIEETTEGIAREAQRERQSARNLQRNFEASNQRPKGGKKSKLIRSQ